MKKKLKKDNRVPRGPMRRCHVAAAPNHAATRVADTQNGEAAASNCRRPRGLCDCCNAAACDTCRAERGAAACAERVKARVLTRSG